MKLNTATMILVLVILATMVTGCMTAADVSTDCALTSDLTDVRACPNPVEAECYSGNTKVVGCGLSQTTCVSDCSLAQPAYDPRGQLCEDQGANLTVYPCSGSSTKAICTVTNMMGETKQMRTAVDYGVETQPCQSYTGYFCVNSCD